ncbi:N-acetylglucosamine-6-phosphate deacetylase [Amphibacillus jilinensis]|uniref:N-acetylglucosamine-6-phosphate deacetylase n=1 Tax=Amphibacillus jilinensis TaxID=1216008 RepID=UPI0003028BEB|nr:N-acetylglucosamine-6-phosphate deacetylase [Amphibacillus jilinensis]
MLIKGAKLFLEDRECIGNILIEAGKITKIVEKLPNDLAENTTIIDGSGLNLIPGFIDTHIHGANGADVMDATEDALQTMASYLVKEGTTSFLATTITQSNQQIEAALQTAAHFHAEHGSAELLGIHLEGPFVEKEKAGAQPTSFIKAPNLDLFNHWQQLANGKIRTITMAPELDQDGTFIRALRQENVNVSAGHTNVNFSELKTAVNKGVNQLTHLCNAMNGIHHRDIGAVGGAFLLDTLHAEIIADGIHVSPPMLELIYQNIGTNRLILITDAMRAKGLPAGDYELGGQPVKVTEDRAILADGTLAGSILNMIDGAKQLHQLPDVTLRDIVQIASVNPAKQIHVFDHKGSITVGKDADLLLVDDELNLKMTLTKGKVAFNEE